MKLRILSKLLILFVVLAVVCTAFSQAASSESSGPRVVALSGGFVASLPGGVSSFTVTTASVSKGVVLYEVAGGLAQSVTSGVLITGILDWGIYDNGIQRMVQGNPQITVDGIHYEYLNREQLKITVLDWEMAHARVVQMSLEDDVDFEAIPAESSPGAVREFEGTPGPRQSKGEITIVCADDRVEDLVQMCAAATTALKFLGYGPILPIEILNDFGQIVNGALYGGSGGAQANIVFLDGGFLNMVVPEDAYFPAVPAAGLNHQGESFYSGPWIATHLRNLEYKGGVVFVSSEGWRTIKMFQGQGADLGPTYTKDLFFARPESCAQVVGLQIK